jgi:hypothetical protein
MKMITRVNADYNKVSKTNIRFAGSGHTRLITYSWSVCFGSGRFWSENSRYDARSIFAPREDL